MPNREIHKNLGHTELITPSSHPHCLFVNKPKFPTPPPTFPRLNSKSSHTRNDTFKKTQILLEIMNMHYIS